MAGQPTKYKQEYCELLISKMTNGDSISAFCVEVKISRETFYQWVKVNKDFNEAYGLAKQASKLWWEQLLKAGSINIVPDSIAKLGSKGIELRGVHFALKTRFHEDYGDKTKIEHQNTGDKPLVNITIPSNSREK